MTALGGPWAPDRRLLTAGLIGLVTAAAFEGMAVPTVLPERALGARQLDVESMYNLERFRPRYEAKLNAPLMLGRAVTE